MWSCNRRTGSHKECPHRREESTFREGDEAVMITTKLETLPLRTLAWRLSRFRLQAWVRRAASALGLRPSAQMRLAELTIPDSEIARRVTKHVIEVSPDFLVNHSLRSYLFGAALGLRDGLNFDCEVL